MGAILKHVSFRLRIMVNVYKKGKKCEKGADKQYREKKMQIIFVVKKLYIRESEHVRL